MKFLPQILLVSAVLAGGWLLMRAGTSPVLPQNYSGTLIAPPMKIDDFKLVSPDGAFTRDSLGGRISLVTFGFANCPHICPATMTRLAQAAALIEQNSDDPVPLHVVLVTVDPERDSPAAIDAFAKKFHPAFRGLAGSEAEIRRAANAFGVYFEKQDSSVDGGAQLMAHSTSIFALNRQAELIMLWSGNAEGREIADDVRRLRDET